MKDLSHKSKRTSSKRSASFADAASVTKAGGGGPMNNSSSPSNFASLKSN